MTNTEFLAETKPADHDSAVDISIQKCLRSDSKSSFITFAGAGSGKTYSLKEALDFLDSENRTNFLRQGRQIAVITFTNNAADEIRGRVQQNDIFAISTIHSFCWQAISGFNEDIRKWYLSKIPDDLEDLRDKESRGRGGAASVARRRQIEKLTQMLEWLSEPREFVYDPNGINSSKNSLSHADVLKIFADFLSKPMMAEVIGNKYPFILIDESQDTNKDVINALFGLNDLGNIKVTLGLFGDTMQRIFGAGEPKLGKGIPAKWHEFGKELNRRSARRIVALGNRIRSDDDGRTQFALDGADDGFARFFILPHGTEQKDKVEVNIRTAMAEITGDTGWKDVNSTDTAILLLEHKMAGRRLGFVDLWEALSKPSQLADRVKEGKSSELNFFAQQVLPLVEACNANDKFGVMGLLRDNGSPLLEEEVFKNNLSDPLMQARLAIDALKKAAPTLDITLFQVINIIAEHDLLRIPTKLRAFVNSEIVVKDTDDTQENDTYLNQMEEEVVDVGEDEIDAWTKALELPLSQIKGYRDYLEENSPYRTHQGVKGNEFERVMVIMDDDEAGGFTFSYEQYFGAKELSNDSLRKQKEGKETGLERTRRLFYVTSTRAKSSLVHVIYTSDVEAVRSELIKDRFAREEEVIVIN